MSTPTQQPTTAAERPDENGTTASAPAPQRRSGGLATRVFGAAAMSFPTWAYALFFFVIPVALVVFYSFGYKPDQFTAVATDQLSFDRYPEALSASFIATFFATLRISLLGTFLCLVIALPFAYWLAIKVAPARR